MEIQDVFRRRAEIESNYSKDLEKLSKLLTSRHKEQKLKREGWTSLSSTGIWRQLVAETKKAGRDHAAIAEIYNNNITPRCSNIHDDITRMYKKVRADFLIFRQIKQTFPTCTYILFQYEYIDEKLIGFKKIYFWIF